MTDLDDVVARAVAAGSPAVDDIAARLVRARVAAKLFGTTTPLRIGRYELERQLGAGGGGVVFAATDPELSRKVALKLLATRGHRDAVLAEAHALARLAHPNVVPIFDVGTHDDQIFLVMELVEGGTLRTWLEAAPRTVREIVRAYREAGAGLAAAHRAGFIHRDFKPDNALIGAADHRVRVVDFGLVHEGEGAARAGLGTPRYMPPEQAAGGALTPAADQYAFCASLREALRARKLDAAGTRAESTPRWLEDILTRGLARDPGARHPSMTTLLEALALDPAARWRRRGLVAGVLALGATTFIIGRAQSDSLPACDGGRAELAKVWSPALRDTLAVSLDALGTPYAKQVKPQLLSALGDYATAWSAGHLDACRVHRRGAQSDALFDRRMRCLDAAHAALGAATAVVRESRASTVAQAVVATSNLPTLSRCADPALLATNAPAPPPARAADVADLERQLAARAIEVVAGRPDMAPGLDALVARARALQHAPTLARALRLRGAAAIAMQKRGEAIAPLAEATDLAFASQDLELGVEVFARRAWAQGTSRATRLALDGRGVVEAIARGLPPGAHATRALLANNIGSLELALGNRDAARVALARAFAEQLDVTGPEAVELAQIPGTYALAIDDPARRDRLFEISIANLTRLVGATHPVTLKVRIYAATWREDAARAETEMAAVCKEVVALHPGHGYLIALCATELGWFAIHRGASSEARAWFVRVIAAEQSGASRTSVRLARAQVLRLGGDPRAAAQLLLDYHGKLETPGEEWWGQLDFIEVEIALGLAQADAADSAAGPTLERLRRRLDAISAWVPATTRRYGKLATTLTTRSGSR